MAGPPVMPVGCDNIATAQVTVASTVGGTPIAVARPGRGEIQITNTAATAVYLGIAGVTTATGTLLPGIIGATVVLKTTAAIFGIVASTSVLVTVLETF